MIQAIANDSVRWTDLRSVDMPVLRSFVVRNADSGQTVSMTTESVDGRSRLEMTYVGVVELQVSWPEFPVPAQLDVVDIAEVAAHQLENINYRVAEGSGFFAFWCSDFIAVAIRDN
ncbi:hypothetical protein BWI15_17095 [Kribbella sp. ALI-6-A]|uniref:hypothetical protein n=1 Tax=Kribbella sp. ALI-6-A TaxID=1933817 RepID=UPI00097BE242|nr:hypothetical protein [Kribbella sp. ALI-6-A]ONI71843.1 hypothetical protein BWI15_17095 [Kribbella sp. ALI-6-A]